MTRRELLRRAGLLGAATLIPTFTAACGTPSGDGEEGESSTGDSGTETGTTGGDDLPNHEWEGELGPETLFSHAVASGDPLSDSVILWTRVSPASEEPVELFFEVALDPGFEQRVAADTIPEPTSGERDYTMKIDIGGLEPATSYYYRFYAQGRVSPIGRTRTAPAGSSEHLRFAFGSCASLAHGYFHSYEEIGGRADLDAFILVGDYMYEYGDGIYGDIRLYDPPHECLLLEDYRRRYAHYRGDPALQEAHRQHPFIVTWDDHEIANDGWPGGAQNHSEDEEGEWSVRRVAATQAYFEWLPLREGEPGRVYRALSYGDLVDLIVLDTRYEGREFPYTVADGLDQLYAEGRQLLGAPQESWLFDRLSNSTAQWKLLAQQVLMAQLVLTPGQNGEPNRPLLIDVWDGFDHARRRLYQHISDNAINDVVVLSGDLHVSFANELTVDPHIGYDAETSEGSLAVEFVAPGLSSPPVGFDDATLGLILPVNPHIRYIDGLHKGYVTLDVTPERVHADYWHFTPNQTTDPAFSGSTRNASWSVAAGLSRLVEESGAAPGKTDPPELAP